MNENVPLDKPSSPPGNRASKALTIPPKRLKGSAQCLNCRTELKGPFCYYCGQPDKNFMRFFPVLIREFMEDFLDFDSRLMRTLKPLLFQPGKLTRDYLDGRRFRYTPPLRLYIFSSMAFFILAAMLAGSAIKITSSDADPDSNTITGQIGEVDEAELEAEDDSINIHLGGDDDEEGFNIDGKPWDKETNPFIIQWVPDFINDWINNEIEESPQKGKEIEANPNLIIDQIFDVLPATTFVLLPLVALLFKFWYMFSNKYYIEHLILALHNHSFLFVVFLISMLANSLAGWLEPTEEGWVTTTVFWINIALITWTPIYLLLSLKRVYQQSWTLTVAKYMVIGLSYLFLLSLATSTAAALSFVLL